MTKGRPDGNSRKCLVITVLVLVTVCAFFYTYSWKSGLSPLEYGSKSLKNFGWGGYEDANESCSRIGEGEDDAIPKTIPPGTHPPLCRSDDDPDAVWGVKMGACIIPYSEREMHRARGSGLVPWSARLTTPPRLADFDFSTEMFKKDMEAWQHRADNYWTLFGNKIKPDTIRNVMDMKANLGSFAAALKNRDVWVMNVVPENGPNTLKIIYDRGLIGTVHNWCEAFSTSPRMCDLLHAWTIFSDIIKKECSPEDLLIEMDRILRPKGFIIVHDNWSVVSVVQFIKKYLPALNWEVVAMSDSDQGEDHAVFIIQKWM